MAGSNFCADSAPAQSGSGGSHGRARTLQAVAHAATGQHNSAAILECNAMMQAGETASTRGGRRKLRGRGARGTAVGTPKTVGRTGTNNGGAEKAFSFGKKVRNCDISSAESVNVLFARLPKGMPPAKGVPHAAGVLDDHLIVDLTRDSFEKVLGAKIDGMLNLAEDFTATIAAFGWQNIFGAAADMRFGGLEPSTSTYSFASSACEKGQQWEAAWVVLYERKQRLGEPNAIVHNAAMAAASDCLTGSVALLAPWS